MSQLTTTLGSLEAPHPWLRDLRPGFILAVAFLLLLLLAAAFPATLAGTDPLATNAHNLFAPPNTAHWLGTDEDGRDVWSRIVYAVRPSLLLGTSAALFSALAGAALGVAAGLGTRLADNALMRFADMLQSFPEILLVLVIISFWGATDTTLVFALGVAGVPRAARQVRAQALGLRRAGFVEAALTLGLTHGTVIRRHVLPNAIKPVLVLLPLDIGWKIAAVATLSFLGVGAPPPAPDWGSMLAIDRDYVLNGWWLTAFSAGIITATVLAVNALGRELVRRSEGRV
ncbi:MAG: ABC transporter permease [Acidocella sp.]|uniref:ABC transporter permease n=1 Tax=Acidocella sp. TaxID=50710 RepID=UPI003FC71E5C